MKFYKILLLLPILFVSATACSVQSKKGAGTKDTELKIGSFNIWGASSRTPKIRLHKDPGLYALCWYNCGENVGKIMRAMDCDIYGLQEFGDTAVFVNNAKGEPFYKDGRKTSIPAMMPGYGLVYYSNSERADKPGTAADKGGCGIIYRESMMECVESGSFFLGYKGREVPSYAVEGNPHGGEGYNAVWAHMKLKSNGKEFYLFTTHLCLTSFRSGKGTPKKPDYAPQNAMAAALIRAANEIVPQGVPSIITGDMNICPSQKTRVNHGSTSYATLTSSRWKDVYDTLLEGGALTDEQKNDFGTIVTWGDKIMPVRYDHILVDSNFKIKSYNRWNNIYKTPTGMVCHPSDHCPISATVKF